MADDYKYITLLNTSTPGTYTISINEETIADVAIVGAGGGGVGCAHGSKWYYADGGGGAAFVGTINISAGTYTVTVGAGGASNFNPSSASDAGSVTGGSSSIGDLIIAGGGIRGSGTNCVYPGAGGTLTVNADVISSTIQSNGNNATGGGMSGHGQAQSLYEGYGKGGMGIYGGSVAGTNGYVRIKIRVPNNTPKFYPLMKREKAYWRAWQQPVLTANGTMGGDSFAVSSNVNSSGSNELWKAFNGNSNNDDIWQSVSTNGTVTFDFYNPQPLKLHSLVLNYGNGESYYYPKEVIIQGSDDGNSWTDLTTLTNNAYAASFNIQVNSSYGYKYHRLKFVSFNGYNSDNMYVIIRELIITAKVYDEHWGYKAYNIMRRFIKHAQGDYNPQNVLVIGSPTINEQGVVSGFSTANYIRPTAFKPESNPWEMVWKITTGNDVDTVQTIFGVEDETNTRAGVWIRVQGRVFDLLAQTASSGDWTVIGYGTYTVLPNTTYYIRASWDGSVYTLDYSLNGSDWINQVSVANSTPIYRVGVQNEDAIGVKLRSDVPMNPFLGSIDLSECYMKVSGEYFWTGFYPQNVYGYKAYNIIAPYWESGSQTFNYTGALQTYTVPEGVTQIEVDCVGAKGYTASLEGGLGGRVKTKLTVTPGQELKVWVGQAHSQITTPEYNASDIRTSSADITSEEGLLSRLIVAGGGGDGSKTNFGGGKGGHGGGLIGGSGREGYGTNATGGTQTAGGTGGTHGAVYGGGSGQGNPGTFGLGGATKTYDASSGGCGGAGWYGGGGGSMCTVNKIWSTNGVAGAGGSSYTHPELCSEVSHAQGYQDGNGYVKITYKRRRF